jgi:hypothetical protein
VALEEVRGMYGQDQEDDLSSELDTLIARSMLENRTPFPSEEFLETCLNLMPDVSDWFKQGYRGKKRVAAKISSYFKLIVFHLYYKKFNAFLQNGSWDMKYNNVIAQVCNFYNLFLREFHSSSMLETYWRILPLSLEMLTVTGDVAYQDDILKICKELRKHFGLSKRWASYYCEYLVQGIFFNLQYYMNMREFLDDEYTEAELQYYETSADDAYRQHRKQVAIIVAEFYILMANMRLALDMGKEFKRLHSKLVYVSKDFDEADYAKLEDRLADSGFSKELADTFSKEKYLLFKALIDQKSWGVNT